MHRRTVNQEVAAEADRAIALLRLEEGSGTFEALKANVESIVGAPIVIEPATTGSAWERTTGLWFLSDQAGHVLYRPQDHRLYQLFTVLHEFIHAVGGHQTCGLSVDLNEHGVDARQQEIVAIRMKRPKVLRVNEVQMEDIQELAADEGAYRLLNHLLGGSETLHDVAF